MSRDEHNSATMILRPSRRRPVARSYEQLFTTHYAEIRAACARLAHPGIAIVAIDARRDRACGSLQVPLDPDRLRPLIVGRHTRADLHLEIDRALSLRHLAVIPQLHEGAITVRVLDLRTHSAFTDEDERSCESLVCDGTVFVRCGELVLLLFVTGTDMRWPDDPAQAWASRPPRSHVRIVPAAPDRQWPPPPAEDVTVPAPVSSGRERSSGVTMVLRQHGPITGRRSMLAPDEEPLGIVLVRTDGREHALVLGEQAARRGVLLGRYDRCDGSDEALIGSDEVSRVHLLILTLDDGEPYAIDTASTNGTWVRGAPQSCRAARLGPGCVVQLANGVAEVRYRSM